MDELLPDARLSVRNLNLFAQRSLTETRLRPTRRKRTGLGMPVIDPRFLVTPQHIADLFGDLRRRRWPLPEQCGEDRPHLRHRHSRGFSPPTASAPRSGTTTPEGSA